MLARPWSSSRLSCRERLILRCAGNAGNSLQTTQVKVRLHTRGSTRVPPHPEEPRFGLMAREEGSFHCVVGKEFPALPSHLKRKRSPQERPEELQGRATIPRDPRYLNPFQRILFSLHCLDFHAEDRLTPRWHVGQLCGKASWESLVGKPRGKALRESHRSLDPLDGMRDTAATAQEESPRACPESRL